MENWKRKLIGAASDPELAWKLARAIDELLGRERELIQIGGHEQAVTHRLAVYLEPLFPTWHVDCEYNREGEVPKRDPEGRRVVPDVLVHRRTTDENLLVIEVKKAASEHEVEDQIKKLRKYRRKQGYQHCLFMDVESVLNDSASAIEWVTENDSGSHPGRP